MPELKNGPRENSGSPISSGEMQIHSGGGPSTCGELENFPSSIERDAPSWPTLSARGVRRLIKEPNVHTGHRSTKPSLYRDERKARFPLLGKK
jgi:hypothetical protein